MSDPRASTLLPSLAVMVSGGLWGLFWLPMRAIHDGGLDGTWAVLLYFLVALVPMLPFAWRRRTRLRGAGTALWLGGIFTGAAFACYLVALVWTEVARALVLFYVTPVWSTLLGLAVLGERLTWVRALTLTLGLAGLFVILGVDEGTLKPANRGDWLALASGLGWAIGTVCLHRVARNDAIGSIFAFLVGGTVIMAIVLLALAGRIPPLELTAGGFVYLAATVAFTLPAMFVILWAAGIVSPARVGLLLMMEIVVGVFSAALWAGESVGLREYAGAALVLAAAVVELGVRRPSTPVAGRSVTA